MRTCVYPGSFDPVTNGHIDVMTRAATLFDEVVVAVMANPGKRGLFSPQERMKLLRAATVDLPGVRVDSFSGLLVDYCRSHGVTAVVKGLRASGDFEYELQMSQMNRRLGGPETVFFGTTPEHSYLSSSLVKDVARHGGDVGGLVPAAVREALRERLG